MNFDDIDPVNDPDAALFAAAKAALQDYKEKSGRSVIRDPYGTAVAVVKALQAGGFIPPRKPPARARARKGAGSR